MEADKNKAFSFVSDVQDSEEDVVSLYIWVTSLWLRATQCAAGVTLPCCIPSQLTKKERLGHTKYFSVSRHFCTFITNLPAGSPAAQIQDEDIQRNLTADTFWKEAHHQFNN